VRKSLFFLLTTVLLSCAPEGKQYTLEAEISPGPEAWQVKGSSNLPDQSQILVTLLDPKFEGNYSKNVVVQEFGMIKDQAFSLKLKPLKPISAGSYQVRLSFSPNAYDWSGGKVTAEVGAKGENLHGKYVFVEDGVNKLVNTLKVEYKGK